MTNDQANDRNNDQLPQPDRPLVSKQSDVIRINNEGDRLSNLRVLVLSENPVLADRLRAQLTTRVADVQIAETVSKAIELVAAGEQFDAALIEAELGEQTHNDTPPLIPDAIARPTGLDACTAIVSAMPGIAAIVIAGDTEGAAAVRAMRAGATDLIGQDLDGAALGERLLSAVARQRLLGRNTRTASLRLLATPLPSPTTDPLQALMNEGPLDTSALLADMPPPTDPVEQLREAIADELDLEAVLRSTLEWTHLMCGPANAAIFLANDFDEWTVGAYINHALPDGSAESMLDELGMALCPSVANLNAGATLAISTRAELNTVLQTPVSWLENAVLIAAPGEADQRVRAVLSLFRPTGAMFTSNEQSSLTAAAGLFAEQSARIARVHDRLRIVGDTDDWQDEDWRDEGTTGFGEAA